MGAFSMRDYYLGYDDYYKSNEVTRAMYQATWNGLSWLPCAHLNLMAQCILIELESTSFSEETTKAIYHVK